jgi:hypothetical protein
LEPQLDISQSPSESVLISAPSRHAEFNNEESIEEVPSMKRGYFADQFEVKSSGPFFHYSVSGRVSRTKVTLTPTSMEPDPKYGARQVGASMPLLQEQVCLSLSGSFLRIM